MAKKSDGFIFHVEINRDPEIQIVDETDNLTVGPAVTLNYQFVYKGGIGTGRSTAFSIFVYDRSDISGVGTPDSPEAGTADKPIPVPFGITPATPLGGSPEITENLRSMAQAGIISTNSVFATLTSGQWDAYHKGRFSVTTPAMGYTDAITTFLGDAQIIFPD